MMHTKGPWIAQEMGSEGWAVFTPKNDGKPGRMVASNLAEEYARLIAAAPELLEALLSLTQWVGRGIADGAYSDCVAPDAAVRALDKAEDLIRKAKGE